MSKTQAAQNARPIDAPTSLGGDSVKTGSANSGANSRNESIRIGSKTLAQIRSDFPILSKQINGHPLVWLDNGATTQRPQVVIDRLKYYYENENSNVHRGAHTLAAASTDAYENARNIVRDFIGAPSSQEIVFVRGTTEAINLVANAYVKPTLQPGDEIIVSIGEKKVKIYISATLRNFFGKNSQISVPESTVRKALANLTSTYPEGEKVLFDENNKLRSFIKIYLNGKNLNVDTFWDARLPDDSEILLLPAIAGGAPIEESQNAHVESLISDERRKAVSFDDSEVERFGKHLMLKDIGVKGQKRIKAAKVVVIGVGALGSPVIQYLAAAGVGTIKAIDFDEITLENLQSQVLHGTRDVKRPKVASAKDKVKNINKNIVFEAVKEQLDASNIEAEIEGYDLVIDCTDNYKARYLINDACALHSIPLVFGAIYQFEGQVGIFNLDGGPCLRCQYPSPPPAGLIPSCAEGGAISPLPGIVGSIQANEALKLILGIGEHLNGKILHVDSLYLTSRILKVQRDCHCPICGNNPTITNVEDIDYEELCGLKTENETPVEGFTPEELAHRIENGDDMTIVDVREPHERAILRFPNAIVIPIGQLVRRQKELDPNKDTIFVCKQGKRSELAINTLREAGYTGPLYNLKGGIDAMKDIMFSHEGAWL